MGGVARSSLDSYYEPGIKLQAMESPSSHNAAKLQLASEIFNRLKTRDPAVAISLQTIIEAIGATPSLSQGHFAFRCFNLAKILNRSPADVAKSLESVFSPDWMIEKTVAMGPYLNFSLSASFYGKEVAEKVLNKEFFRNGLIHRPPKTMIEYSQPNTHKELHVGHMRNMCLGDSLIRLHRYCGYEILSATFPGDVGTHVAKCLWYLKYHNQEPVPETDKGSWLGRMYSKGHLKLEDELGTAAEPSNKAKLSEILKQLEAKSGEFYDLWKETRQWSIDLMEEVYDWAEIEFDHWYWESEVDSPSVHLAKEYYAKGLFVESDGALGMDLSEDGLGFAMILKSDGTGLYLTKDLELARRKFEESSIERSIYIVDKRQAHHFAQVFKVLEKIGFENAKNCFHLKYDYVELPDGAMSSRKGNIIPLTDLISEMERSITEDYLEKYRGEWEDYEIQEVAEDVAKGAIRYGMLRIDPNKKIVFDMKEWIRIDGDSGPYIQYVCARIDSLLRKLGYSVESTLDWSLLDSREELAIQMKLCEFNDIILYACENYKTSTLCNYLYDLGKVFNVFYGAISIKGTRDEILRNTRLALAKAVSNTLHEGLGLLGVPVPKRM